VAGDGVRERASSYSTRPDWAGPGRSWRRARIIARRYGEQSEKESDKSKDLGEELADVLFVLLCLANQTGIDLQASFDKKMDFKANRDHDRHHNNEKLKS